jgi:hypothetical protein
MRRSNVHNDFFISFFILLLFDAAKLQIIADIAKLLGYSARFCDGWHKNNQGRTLVSSLTH